MLKKLGLAMALLAFISVAGLSGAASGQEYPGGATVTVSPTVILPCQTGTITGTGFPADSTGTVTVGGTGYSITTGATGTFSVAVNVPCAAVSGTQLPFVVAVGGISASGTITVGSASSTAKALPVTGRSLPVTGSGDTTSLLARAGLVLVLAGGAVLFVSMSHRKHAPVA